MGHDLTSLFLTVILIGSSISLTSALTCENCVSFGEQLCQPLDQVRPFLSKLPVFNGKDKLDPTIVEHPDCCIKVSMKVQLPGGHVIPTEMKQGIMNRDWETKNVALDDSCYSGKSYRHDIMETTICSYTRPEIIRCNEESIVRPIHRNGQSIVKPIHILLLLPLIAFVFKFTFL